MEMLKLLDWIQVHWLRENEGSTALMQEIEAEGKRVWKFVIDREIEAPERFRAIQSYRLADATALHDAKSSLLLAHGERFSSMAFGQLFSMHLFRR